MVVFAQQIINGLSLGGIYALIALGYTMVYGIIELINFAHGDVYTLGTFTALAVLTGLGVSGELHGPALVGVVAVALVASMLLCGVVGMLIERLAYRRLRSAPRLAPLITAIGVSFILENVMQLWRGPSPVPFPQVVPNPSMNFGGVDVSAKQVMVIVLAIAMMIALQTFIYNTKMGKAMRATAQDRDAAQLMGININTTIAVTFLIGSALAGRGFRERRVLRYDVVLQRLRGRPQSIYRGRTRRNRQHRRCDAGRLSHRPHRGDGDAVHPARRAVVQRGGLFGTRPRADFSAVGITW